MSGSLGSRASQANHDVAVFLKVESSVYDSRVFAPSYASIPTFSPTVRQNPSRSNPVQRCFGYNTEVNVTSQWKRIRPVKYCYPCRLESADRKCPRCGHPTIPNPSLHGMRFPRYSEEVDAAIKAAKKQNEDIWLTRPYQGGLPQ